MSTIMSTVVAVGDEALNSTVSPRLKLSCLTPFLTVKKVIPAICLGPADRITMVGRHIETMRIVRRRTLIDFILTLFHDWYNKKFNIG